ncbi:hypothetical protein PCASD_08895 [Puccinia coronata f. sp. avenae]|uniref:Uncharacterized protein n=1 Tax=Puccinia coronata f. sp. avenae TaxID=200324 RepID=A0A2N5UUD7_9BASI|nr:hypothetical protein PCASD_08895 [Puccinia coronata f. sp. avenae]
MAPSSSLAQKASASESSAIPPSAARSRSASHPIKTAFLSTKKAIQHQFIHPSLAQQHATTASLIPPANVDPTCDDTHKASDALRFKSRLFSPPSNPQISVGFISRQFLEPVCPPQTPHCQSNFHNKPLPGSSKVPSAQAIPLPLHSSNCPIRPIRSNMVDPDLMVREPLPVIVSSLVDQPIKKRSHRRRWTTQRSKNNNSLDSNAAEPFDLFFINQQALLNSGSAAGYNIHNIQSLKHSEDKQNECDSSLSQSLQFNDPSHPSRYQLPVSCSSTDINHKKHEDADYEDLTTPTLQSCEKFQDDNSITPCQTYSTPSFTKTQRDLRMTPRMIYEDYQRKFKQEDIIIQSSDPKLLSEQFSSTPWQRPLQSNVNHTINTNPGDHVLSSAIALHEPSVGDSGLDDPADESFECYGDGQVFGTRSPSKSQRISPVIDIFPLPPAPRSSCLPSNVQRTPSPKQMMGQDLKAVGPENMTPRHLLGSDKSGLGKSGSASPLILGKPLRVNSSPRHHTKSLTCRPPNFNCHTNPPFQLQPSPYRHMEHASSVHDGPDHLESSARLMQMFDSFLESSPKSSVLNASPRSSLSRKSTRKLKLDHSPLRKMSSLHFPETPQPILPSKLTVTRDTFGRNSHRTPFTTVHHQRASALAHKQSMKNLNLETSASSGTKNSSFVQSLPQSGSLFSPPPSADGSKHFPSNRDDHSSPASDSDYEPSPSPKTPFGNFFNPPNHLELTVPNFDDPTLSRDVFLQKLDAYNCLSSQPHSLEVLEADGSMNRFSNPTKLIENRTRASKHEDVNQVEVSHAPQIKNKSSAARLSSIADGILSRFTNQRCPKEPLHLGESFGQAMRDPAHIPPDEGFDSSAQNSNWTSILEYDFYPKRETDLLNVRSTVGQKMSSFKPISGRILFEESSHGSEKGVAKNQSQKAARSNNSNDLSDHYLLKQLINLGKTAGPSIDEVEGPSQIGERKPETSRSPLVQPKKRLNSPEQEIIIESTAEVTEDVSNDVQQILSPIRLYGKQQGVLETGNWKTNNLNFQSMKSQYQPTFTGYAPENSCRIDSPSEIERSEMGTTSRRDRTMTEETQKQRGYISQEEEEQVEREKKESLLVYKIQEEDENQIINFEMNRLRRIFHHKALKSFKSKSKLSSKPLAKLFHH